MKHQERKEGQKTKTFIEVGTFPSECIIKLTSQEQVEMLRIITSLQRYDYDSAKVRDAACWQKIKNVSGEIPKAVASKLKSFREISNDYGTLLIRNLPIDVIIPHTPFNGEAPVDKKSSVSEYCLLLLMMWLGHVISYADEKKGHIIHQIVPVQGQEGKQENTGSRFLEFHSEDAFHPYPPDHLALYCIRGDRNRQAITATASILRAINYLHKKYIPVLMQHSYHIRYASSFTGRESTFDSFSSPMPVLYESKDGNLGMWIDFHAMEVYSTETEAEEALEAMKKALMKVIVGHILEPGDLLIVDNRTAAHLRTGFVPYYDGFDRWLQRCFTVNTAKSLRMIQEYGPVLPSLQALSDLHQ